MEFYGYEATILTKPMLRSILLLKIHIAKYERSIFALLNIMVQSHWSMDTYFASFFLIDYYYFLFYSLEHGATIVTSYCTILTSDAMVPPTITKFLSINMTWLQQLRFSPS